MGISPPPSGACRIAYGELNPSLPQILISLPLLCLLQRWVDSSGSNQLSPRAGSSPHSASASLLGGIVKAPPSPAGIIQGPRLHPASPSSQSALFQIELCSLPFTGERTYAFLSMVPPLAFSPQPAAFLNSELSTESPRGLFPTTDLWPWRKFLPVPKTRPPERP